MATNSRSVLDAMASGIMTTKAAKARTVATLTPLPATPSSIPNVPTGDLRDDPDFVLQALAAARRDVEAILDIVTRLETAWGKPSAVATVVATDPVSEQKALERAADAAARERDAAAVAAKMAAIIGDDVSPDSDEDDDVETFADRQTRLAAEAQAATFAPEPVAGWTCPEHGTFVDKVSVRRGVQYRACAQSGCGEFQKL